MHTDGITTETVVSGIAYAPFGPLTSLMFGNGITLSRDHGLDYRLTSQAAGSVQDLSFGYDGNGNLTALTDAIDGSRNWGYDAVGNRLSSTGGGSETYGYAADSNRLIEYTTGSRYTVSYDANDNITGDGYYGFSYGDHNRLTEARVLGSPVATYSYNGLGQRVTKDNGAVTHFVYDQAGRLLGEYDGTGATRKEVIRLNGVPVAVFAGGAVSYVHSDQLGTPRLITDGTGTVRWRWDSAPFGDTQADGDPDGDGSYAEFNLRFPGQYYDSETGLHYNYYRDYIPGFGRYLQSDPIGLDGGLNTYGYALQNPLSYTDALGLAVEECGDDGSCIQKCLDEYYGEILDWAWSTSFIGIVPASLTIASSVAQDELSRQANRNRYTGRRNSALGGRHGYATGARQARLLRFFSRFNTAATAAGVGATFFIATAYANCAIRCAR